MNYLFVTGMFRSGTTLMAKMFDAHPEIAFASDPYRPFFNDLRDTIANKNGLLKNNHPHMPLSDYFCDDEQLSVMKFIQSSTLNEDITEGHLNDLKIKIRDRGMEFSPFAAKRVDELKGRTYRELFHSMMALIHKCYGKGDEEIIGIKEVWTNEFTGILLKCFPSLKAINIVRDPRAVFASNHATGAKYPWTFLARQWRKLTIFTWLFSTCKEFSDSLLVLKYEDLAQKPEETAKKICSFLNINFSSDMVDGTKFRDGDGSPWHQNSSYGKGKQISTQYIDKWKEVLSQEEVRLIEMLCYHEMRLFGYEPLNENVDSMSKETVYEPLIVKDEELAQWIREYSDTRVIFNFAEMAKEFIRSELLRMDETSLSRIDLDDKIIEALFISKDYFNHARGAFQHKEKVVR